MSKERRFSRTRVQRARRIPRRIGGLPGRTAPVLESAGEPEPDATTILGLCRFVVGYTVVGKNGGDDEEE